MDRALMRRLVRDRVTGIALSCAVTFLLMMAGATFVLTWTSPFFGRSIIVPPLGYAISFLLGVAIVGVLRIRAYGSDYEQNDDLADFEVDWNDPSLYDEEVLAFDRKHARKNYLRRHWVGHLSLPVSYWINNALLSAAILALATFLSDKIRSDWGSLRGLAGVSLLYLCVCTIVWVWSSVGIWRSAYWHRRRGGSPGWGLAARALVLISVLATVLRSEDIALQAAELGGLAAGRDSIGEVAAMIVSSDGRVLTLRGNLSVGAADRFETLLGASPKVTEILLSSPGGRMFEAERMARLIRQRRLDTRVDDFCMSACTDLLLAGVERTAPEAARVGFHQPSFPGVSAYELSDAIEETRSRYLAAGVEPGFVWRALATPAEGMWFPSADELLAANVLTDSGDEIVVSGR